VVEVMLHTVALFKFEMQDVFGLNGRKCIPNCTFSTFVTLCFISLKLGTLQNIGVQFWFASELKQVLKVKLKFVL